jgi:DNA mismatch endonuclease (patch repair protein)
MSRIRSKHTRFEKKFHSALISKDVDHIEWNPSEVFGKPDFVHRESKTAIFLDSCFWHGCPHHLRMPKSNTEYWQKKIERNRKRDRLVTRTLKKEGWCVMRIWEHSLFDEASFEKWSSKVSNCIHMRVLASNTELRCFKKAD